MYAFGMLVTTASTSVPMRTSGMPAAWPSWMPECTMPMLPRTMTASAGGMSEQRPRVHVLGDGCRGASSSRRNATTAYGTSTTSATTSAAQAGTTPNASSTIGSRDGERDAALERERVPLDPHAAARSSALTPIIAARLNTFEPTTTPKPTLFEPLARAAIAVESSGASAPRAVSSPSSPSGRPIRAPRWSSRSAKTDAA